MSSKRYLSVEVAPDPPGRLDKVLARDVPSDAVLSRSRLAKIIAAGGVRRGAEILDSPKSRVRAGDVLVLEVSEGEETELIAQSIALDIIHEDADLIVVNKPAGMVVHPAPGSPDGTLVNALLAHCGDTLSGIGGEKRPGIVHRIDKDTSGLLVVAKSDRAHQGLSAQFAAHSVDRHYRAIVHGVPEAGDPRLRGLAGISFEAGGVLKIETRVGRHPHDRQRQAVLASGGRHAVTRARVLERFGSPGGAALLDCYLETGRTHQIRVHMSHAGHGLVGDATYGGARRLSAKAFGFDVRAAVAAFPRQALHAATLGFSHPVSGAAVAFEAPVPVEMGTLLETLRSNC